MNKNPQYNLKSSPKLKIIVILVFSFIVCQNLSSQFYWQKTYDSFIGGDDEGYDGCAADGSNFYIVGYTGIVNYYMYVLKMNQLGDTLWTRTYIGGIAKAVAPSNDGGCVFTRQRNSCFSMKLDLNGNVVWDKSYPTGAETRDITQTGDSGYVMCGGFFSGYICKLDTLGNLQWERYYSDSPQDFDEVIPYKDGYVLCGSKRINNIWKGYLANVDFNGNVIWETFFEYSFASSFAKINNGFVVCSGFEDIAGTKVVLLKTDVKGIVFSIDTVNTGGTINGNQTILEMNNQFYLSLFASIPSHYGYVGKVLKLDSNLSILKNITLVSDTNSLILHKIFKSPGSILNDLIVLGSAEPRGLYEVDLYIARLDSKLTQPPPLTVNVISTHIPKESSLMQNYPNPFNGTTLIKFSILKSDFVRITIFDVLGREVETLVSENLSPGIYSTSFSSKNLASGIYFYQLKIEGKIISTQKMIHNK